MELKDINKNNKYEGYIWESNSSKPKVLNREPIPNDITWEEGKNPFVIEALLFDKDNQMSYTVRYIDGTHKVFSTKVDDNELVGNIHFISKRTEPHHKLRFFQRWITDEDTDNLCEGMPTKIPGELVFVGFETSKEKEE